MAANSFRTMKFSRATRPKYSTLQRPRAFNSIYPLAIWKLNASIYHNHKTWIIELNCPVLLTLTQFLVSFYTLTNTFERRRKVNELKRKFHLAYHFGIVSFSYALSLPYKNYKLHCSVKWEGVEKMKKGNFMQFLLCLK